MVEELLGEDCRARSARQVGYLLSRRAFRRFRKRVDYSEYGGAPLLGVTASCIVGHGRSSAKAMRNAIAAWRIGSPTARVGRALEQRHRRSRGVARNDRLRVSRAGLAEGRHGPGAGRRVPRVPSRRSTRPTRRSASRSSQLVLRRPRGPADAHREHPAGDPDGQHRRLRGCSRRAGSRPALVAGHSLGEYSAHVAAGTFAFADAVRIVRRRGRYMQEGGAGGHRAPWRRCSALDGARCAQACDEAAEGEVVEPGQPQRAGAGRHCRHARAVARAGERAKARGARRVIPLPVSAPFHCALMQPARGAAGAGAAGARRRATRECRSWPTSTPSRSATRARRHRRAGARRCRRRCAGRMSCAGLRRRASARMLKWVRARC